MRGRLERFFAACGQSVTLCRGEKQIALRASVQPQTSGGEDPTAATPLGAVDERRWVYIGPGNTALFRHDLVESGGERYRVLSATPVYLGETVLYWHGLLRLEREAAG